MATSNNAIKSFSLGYRATNAVIDGVAGTAGVVVGGVVETKQVSTSFFAGIRYAISERRGNKAEAPISKDEAAERKLREAQELYARAQAAKHKESAVEGEFIPAAE